MAKDLAIIETSDGSNSIQSKQYQATYHSIHGAIEESMHIFISAGLYYKFCKGYKKLQVFEMGFGTGLNAFLSLIAAKKYQLQVEYHSIELHPLEKELYIPLNFHSLVPNSEPKDLQLLHELSWEKLHIVNEYFSFKKIQGDLHTFQSSDRFDLIFYDAFAPSSQPSLWEESIQTKLYSFLKPKGALLTYCAQGKFKRTLKAIGYQLDQLDGPGRKHEMTRAVKV